MELKTLKDLMSEGWIRHFKLKAEAVKELELAKDETSDLAYGKRKMILLAETYIKWKNNLTEEDLKWNLKL